MLNDKVFVFVPSYNHARFVERCLQSIIKQTLQPIKLLVIDDGSKDDSPKIIEKVLKDCPFPAELIARENRGLCRTLNEGFERSAGEFFAYLGSDDVWLPEFLKRRVELLGARAAAVLAYGHAYTIDDEDNIIESSQEWANFPDGDASPLLLGGSAPFSPTVVYRRSALEKVKWNENSKLEDYELYLRLCDAGEFAFDPQVLAAWRQHDANSSGNLKMMLAEILNAQKQYAAQNRISSEQLRQIQAAAKLLYSEMFARSGNKTTALSLLLQNIEFTTPTFTFKQILRLLTPLLLTRIYREKKHRRATSKYGKIFDFA